MNLAKIMAVALLVGVAAFSVAKRSHHALYDSKADPQADVRAAKETARSTHRRVLVIAGGDWCRWCLALDKFVSDDPEVKTSLDAAFVTVHAYYGDENENQAFFSRLPEADGYPHFWVLDGDGGLIRSVSTADLENGDDGYNKAAFLEFIRANQATR